MVATAAPENAFPPTVLAALGTQLLKRRYAQKQPIYLAGEPETSLVVIERGMVKLSLLSDEGRELILARLHDGDVCGEVSLLDGGVRTTDAIAVEPTYVSLLPREAFLTLLATQPSVATQLLAMLSRRLRQDVETLEDLAFRDVSARLAKALLRIAGTEGKPTASPGTIATRLTQTELAGLVGATRESVNKCLGAYERQGLIRRANGHITVLRLDQLRGHAA